MTVGIQYKGCESGVVVTLPACDQWVGGLNPTSGQGGVKGFLTPNSANHVQTEGLERESRRIEGKGVWRL